MSTQKPLLLQLGQGHDFNSILFLKNSSSISTQQTHTVGVIPRECAVCQYLVHSKALKNVVISITTPWQYKHR